MAGCSSTMGCKAFVFRFDDDEDDFLWAVAVFVLPWLAVDFWSALSSSDEDEDESVSLEEPDEEEEESSSDDDDDDDEEDESSPSDDDEFDEEDSLSSDDDESESFLVVAVTAASFSKDLTAVKLVLVVRSFSWVAGCGLLGISFGFTFVEVLAVWVASDGTVLGLDAEEEVEVEEEAEFDFSNSCLRLFRSASTLYDCLLLLLVLAVFVLCLTTLLRILLLLLLLLQLFSMVGFFTKPLLFLKLTVVGRSVSLSESLSFSLSITSESVSLLFWNI